MQKFLRLPIYVIATIVFTNGITPPLAFAKKVHPAVKRFLSRSSIRLGNFNPSYKKYQKDESGNLHSFQIQPFLGYQYEYPLTRWIKKSSLSISLDWAIKRASDHDVIKRGYYLMDLSYGFHFNRYRSKVYAGPGILYTEIEGEGGSSLLGNGTSTTSFPNPQMSVVTSQYYWQLGLASHVYKLFFVDLNIGAVSPLNSLHRTFNFRILVSYRFGKPRYGKKK